MQVDAIGFDGEIVDPCVIGQQHCQFVQDAMTLWLGKEGCRSVQILTEERYPVMQLPCFLDVGGERGELGLDASRLSLDQPTGEQER